MAYEVYDASPTADAVSARCSIQNCSKFSFHVIWAGTQAGTLYIQESNLDDPSSAVSSTDWVTSTVTFPANPAGSASSTFQDFFEGGSQWVRVLYDYTSGSGRVQVFFMPKTEI